MSKQIGMELIHKVITIAGTEFAIVAAHPVDDDGIKLLAVTKDGVPVAMMMPLEWFINNMCEEAEIPDDIKEAFAAHQEDEEEPASPLMS